MFSERQRFRQWWLWALIFLGPTILLFIVFYEIVIDLSVNNNPTDNYVLFILGLVCGVGFPLVMYRVGLDTEVRTTGLYIRFWPFHRKWVGFLFDDIQRVKPHIYSPLRDYGGWGIRYGRKGKAYNVSGNKGVLVSLASGENILIGSNEHTLLYKAINERLLGDRDKSNRLNGGAF